MVPDELQEQSPKLVLFFYRLFDLLPDDLPVCNPHLFSLGKSETSRRVVVEPWYDVNVHVEYFLRGSSPIRLADVYPVSFGGFANSPHNFGHGDEEASHLFRRHFMHEDAVFLGQDQRVAGVQGILV